VQVIYQDILTVNVGAVIGDTPYTVVANVPYYITSAILRLLLEDSPRPRRLVLTMQQEVAERIIAKPGDMSLLAVSVQFYGKPRLVTRINPAAFWPRPDVDSAVLRIDLYDQPLLNVPDEKTFFRVVRAGFSQKRKQIKNALNSGLGLSGAQTVALLERAHVDAQRRAETLTLEEWASLARAMQPTS
jgi:16S rRNA (adenine1518-N6/adenine1519-N6)-dimethyltransferase